MQTIYQDRVTQPGQDNVMENILKTLTTLCTKVDSMGLRIQKLEENVESTSQQHDYKHAELRHSADEKQPELEGEVGKLQKTHNRVCLNTAAGTSKKGSEKPKNMNLNQLFVKPFIKKPQIQIPVEPQTSTYAVSLQNDKKRYNYITQSYIENIYNIQTYLNLNPRSTQTKNPEEDYIT